MKFSYNFSFTHENHRERSKKVAEIRYNLHESIYELVRNVSMLGLNFDSAEHRIKADYILGIGKYPPHVFDDVSPFDSNFSNKNPSKFFFCLLPGVLQLCARFVV